MRAPSLSTSVVTEFVRGVLGSLKGEPSAQLLRDLAAAVAPLAQQPVAARRKPGPKPGFRRRAAAGKATVAPAAAPPARRAGRQAPASRKSNGAHASDADDEPRRARRPKLRAVRPRRCGPQSVPRRWAGRRARETFQGKHGLLAAIDKANDGLLTQWLELLDPGSPELAALSERASRRGPYRFKAWRDAIYWVAPPKAHRFETVDPERLKLVSEAMHRALEAGGGGITELHRAGRGFPGLSLPRETEAIIERRREAERVNAAVGVPF